MMNCHVKYFHYTILSCYRRLTLAGMGPVNMGNGTNANSIACKWEMGLMIRLGEVFYLFDYVTSTDFF